MLFNNPFLISVFKYKVLSNSTLYVRISAPKLPNEKQMMEIFWS